MNKHKMKITGSLLLDFLVIPLYFILAIIKGIWGGLVEFTRDIKYTSYYWKRKINDLME